MRKMIATILAVAAMSVFAEKKMIVHNDDATTTEILVSSIDSITFSEYDSPDLTNNDSILLDAFDNQISDIQVTADGEVIAILEDDIEGDKHQKFIIRLSNSQTILITHNIDLAPRVDPIEVGDQISIYGEYEWSAKGGTIHWTHIDPAGNHTDGWIKHNGEVFQ
jgi:hypothetical protein